jgi:hypothetical protein
MFKQGDKVRIRLWKDMMKTENVEVNASGDLEQIGTGKSFTQSMRRFCGRSAIVRNIDVHGIELVIDEFGIVDNRFCEWMLETTEERYIL